MRWTVITMACATLSVASLAWAVDDGRGRDWRPLPQTQPTSGKPTWEQVAAQCPSDGVTPCAGKLGNIELKDWIWATRPQVIDLFSLYAPAIVNAPDASVFGPEYQAVATQFQALFGITMHLQGCPTYQPCFNSKWGTGMTSSVAAVGPPAAPWGAEVSVDLEWGGGGFRTFTPLHPDMGRGLWMWRPTGLGTSAAHAYDDSTTMSAPGGGIAIADVMANDWVSGQRATPANGVLSQLTSAVAGVWLDVNTGAVRVENGTAAGTYTFDYRLCNRISPTHCDDAAVSINVPSFALTAAADAGTIAMAQGGTAIVNVLANDRVGTFAATTAWVQLSAVSSSHPGVTLDTTTGAVRVAAGTPHGVHTLLYRICERANLGNCAQATATVSPNSIDAVNDSARGSSKKPNTPLASVLTNDRFANAVATPATVTLSLVSISPPNPKIRLDLVDGSIDVLGRTNSGLYNIVYRICETASPANCDQATVTLDLSGGR